MLKKLFTLLLSIIVATVFSFQTFAINNTNIKNETIEFSTNTTPANEIAIAKKLKEDGIIPDNASDEAVEKAVDEYVNENATHTNLEQDKEALTSKLSTLSIKNDKIKKNLVSGIYKEDEVVEKGEETKISEPVYENEPKLLVLLAEFSEDEYGDGPLHNEIEKPSATDTSSFWVDDFSPTHFQDMLFTIGGEYVTNHTGEEIHLSSMTDYYLEQSGNSMKVDGGVYGWFKLPHSEAYYGDDDVDYGHDNLLPGTPQDLVADLLVEARPTVPFEDYDIEDPDDLDEDGITDEPDGIIDHLVIVHAGIDQSGGGGAQGDDAIWAHSSSVYEEIPSDNPTSDNFGGNMIAANYIIQGEDSTIGVFCHEFGHDLGLPDDYDTQYTASGEPVGFYSLMSSGSWTGEPLGSKPTSISPWGRMVLGSIYGGQWIQPTEIDIEDLSRYGEKYTLDESSTVDVKNNQAIKVNLPQYRFDTVTPKDGEFEWYGGKADEIDYSLGKSVSLPESDNITFSFDTNYVIEEGWDFAFVQISEDNGKTWTSLASDKMTSEASSQLYPTMGEYLPGYTGNSNGWINDSLDLSDYSGKDIMIQFRYMTDWGTTEEGIYLDNIKLIADDDVLFEDGAEDGESDWIVNGFSLSKGYKMKDHYYMMEWRTNTGVDEGLNYCYTVNSEGELEYFKTEEGLLIWYRNLGYTENWVGNHPGKGFLGIVDAHPEPIKSSDSVLRTRLQIHDAAFNKSCVPSKEFSIGDTLLITDKLRYQNKFSDSKTYWYEESPDSGLILTEYGLNVKVLKTSRDNSKGYIKVYKK
jgi:immune inhibitor A